MEHNGDIVKRETASNNAIASAVAKSLAWTRTQINEKEVMFMVSEVQAVLNKDFAGYCLSASEVEAAFKHGCFGEYGKYYGINTVTLVTFLQEYVASDEFISSRRHPTQHLALPQKATVTDKEITQTYARLVIQALADFRNSGSLPISAHRMYDFLAEKGIVNVSPKKKWECMDAAASQMQREVKKAKGFKLSDLMRKYADTHYTQCTQIAIAKRILLRDIFENANDDFVNKLQILTQ